MKNGLYLWLVRFHISNVFGNSGTVHISAVVSTRGEAYVRNIARSS